MADYLSRNPSDSKRENQLKAEELSNNWFTVNEIKSNKPVLNETNGRNTATQPIKIKLAETATGRRDGSDKCERT